MAEDARQRDFRGAVPNPRHRLWGWLVGVPAVARRLACWRSVPPRPRNAWQRLIAPWRNTPRYTFAAVEPLPGKLVVAHGEPFAITARLREETAWRPREGVAQLGEQQPITAPLEDGRYEFELPVADRSRLARGPHRRLDPAGPDRADLASRADLGRRRRRRCPNTWAARTSSRRTSEAARSRWSRARTASFTASASRELSAAQVDGQQRQPAGPDGVQPGDQGRWRRGPWSSAGRTPSAWPGRRRSCCRSTAATTRPPRWPARDLPRQKVVLDSEALNFKVKAQDDFGVKRVGMEWQGRGERRSSRRRPRASSCSPPAATTRRRSRSAARSRPSRWASSRSRSSVRIFAEDYFPGRARVYSPTYTLYVLNAEQHAIWLTEQLSKWHRQSLEVRDREMQLFETNKQLRALAADELDRPETRRRIENQAAAERTNGRRLSNLVATGEDLVQQAMRNPEFGVGHLEKWAEMLQILKDISANRMPSVADLLKQASQAPGWPRTPDEPTRRRWPGMVRDAAVGAAGRASPTTPRRPRPGVPQIVDRESSQQPLDKDDGQQPRRASRPASRA